MDDNTNITTTQRKTMKPYEIRQIKETTTGTRYLVRHNTYGKWIICSSVNDAGNCITNPETSGKYDYVMKKWKKLQRKTMNNSIDQQQDGTDNDFDQQQDGWIFNI